MKKVLIILLTFSLLLVCALAVNAANASGKCGDNLTWTLDGSHLTISGTGDMYDYSEENPAPWSQSSPYVYRLAIEPGVTSIGDYAFAQDSLHRAELPGSIRTVGKCAFADQRNVKTFFLGGAPTFADDFASGASLQIYTVGWNDNIKKNYGGTITWFEADLRLDAPNSKRLIGINEEVLPEDVIFQVYNQGKYMPYTPAHIALTSADNSTYGEKNITITIDGYTFPYTYFVTDGTNHLDLIQVEFDSLPTYTGNRVRKLPIVKMGNLVLIKDDDYTLTFNDVSTGIGQVTIVGKGIAEGFEKTFYYPILKQDISNVSFRTPTAQFNGMPVETEVYAKDLFLGIDITTLYQNNINVGTANVRIVGINECYGDVSKTFQINANPVQVALHGNCIGTADSELSEDYYLGEMIVRPAQAKLFVVTGDQHIAAINLYKLVGEEFVLVAEQISDVGNSTETQLEYDFTSIYEEEIEQGGAIYMVSYSWVNYKNEVYAGVMYLLVPAKVPEATSMYMERVENDGDFRKEYFNLCGEDGTLGQITWNSSNPSVAMVEDGIVTMHKPGTVTISGQCGNLMETYVLTVPQLYLNEGIIFDYSEASGARVIYDGRLLTEGTDYVLSVTQEGDAVTVTASGRGLFTGELMKTFDGLDSLADPHTHAFDRSCDDTCNGCDYTRSVTHQFADTWKKNLTHHYHVCTVCGEKDEGQAHSLSAEDETLCTVCGTLYLPGDFTGDCEVTNEDVIYLLWHTLFPDTYPITSDADFTGDGEVTNEDVIHLLWYTLFPDSYPLS